MTLRRPTTTFHIPCVRQPVKLPVILSQAEVAQLFAAAPALRHRTLLQTTYSAEYAVLPHVLLAPSCASGLVPGRHSRDDPQRLTSAAGVAPDAVLADALR